MTTRPTRADEIVNGYLRRSASSEEAYHRDAQYHMQIKWLRQALLVLDLTMDDEGVPEETRIRVLRAVLYGTAEDPHETQLRIQAVR